MSIFTKIFFDSDGTTAVARVPQFIEEGDIIRVLKSVRTWKYSPDPEKGLVAEVTAILGGYDSRSVVSAKVVMTKLHHTVIAKVPTIYKVGETVRIRWDAGLKMWVAALGGEPAKILKI